jgi:cytoskeleton protein RodZ
MEGQEATPSSVADSLRRGREEKGLSLEEVRATLGIPAHYLEAMEGRTSALIADELYLVPFLRRYAEFLDLDAPMVVSRFLVEAGRGEPAKAKARRASPDRSPVWIAVAVLALLVIVAIVWVLLSGRHADAEQGGAPAAVGSAASHVGATVDA